jgi:hypothetical protein
MDLESSAIGHSVNVDVPLPGEPCLIDIDLIPAGNRSGVPNRVTSLVCVSEPVISPLDVDQVANDTPHLSAYLQQRRRTHEVTSLTFACSFTSRSHPVIRAVVAISLTRDDQAVEQAPIAWRLQPNRIDKPTRTLPAKLSFDIAVPPKAHVEVGPIQEDPHKQRYIILAHGEGTTEPEWLFRRTSQHDFDGIHWLGMIVLLPRKTPATAQIALTSSIRHHKLGIIPCSADLPERISRFPLRL